MNLSFLDPWQEYAREHFMSILAVAALLVTAIGCVLFVVTAILPQLQTRSELTAELSAAKTALVEQDKVQALTPKTLRGEISSAQAQFSQVTDAILTEAQAAQVLNRLYQYAGDTRVTITDLQMQPHPTGDEKGSYAAQTFRVQVEGSVRNLIAFVSQIREASLTSVNIRDVSIGEGKKLSSLTMDIQLYTSPYASGKALTQIESIR